MSNSEGGAPAAPRKTVLVCDTVLECEVGECEVVGTEPGLKHAKVRVAVDGDGNRYRADNPRYNFSE